MKSKKEDKEKYDVETLIGGKSNIIKKKDKQYRIEVIDIPECSKACPAGINVKAYVNLIANRKFEEAVEEIRKANPFPAVCGRVCTRPCENFCEIGKNGDPVSIRDLKRYASDYELVRRPITSKTCEITHSKKIGIIGAGPAGLTAAVDLIRLGYPITVFEASDEPGGMLRYGIPAYRLPDRVLNREIDWIKGLGIKIETKNKIKDPADLLKQGYSAVLIAGGAPKSLSLGIKGERAEGTIDALKFLRNINEGKIKNIKGKLVVIGAGSTAFDAARSAIRLGAEKVTLAYRRGIDEMPAEKEEIDAAINENVKILTLTIPKKIIEKDGKVKGVEFYKARLGKLDSSGRGRPIPIENSEFVVEADYVIPAIGAMADIGLINGLKVLTQDGVIEVKENCDTVLKGVYAAGDVEMGPSTVVEAIGRGHVAARGIDAYLRDIFPISTEDLTKTLQIVLGTPTRSKTKFKPKRIEKKEKISDFDEVSHTIDDFEAVEEASRCLSCGPCYACPTCLPNCVNKQLVAEIQNKTILVKSPIELSKELYDDQPKIFKIPFKGSEQEIKLYSLISKVDKELCIGCGRCEEVCAYRAIKNIVTKDDKTFSQVEHDSCASCSACVSECPSGAITQGYMNDDEILKRLEKKQTPFDGIKAFISYWSTPSPFFDYYDGIVELMSARKPSPMFLIRALARAGRGLLVIKPDSMTGSHYLPWEEPPELVIENTWRLLELAGISPKRIKYVDLLETENPLDLLNNFKEELDRENLDKLKITLPDPIKSPFGKAMALLRVIGANPDQDSYDGQIKYPIIEQNSIALFEGCLPMLDLMGKAHKLFNLERTRFAIFNILKNLNIHVGAIRGLSCPSTGLLKLNVEGVKEVVKEISKTNLDAIKKSKPKKIIVTTPEAFESLSNDKKYGHVSSIVDELFDRLKNSKKLKRLELTVALHKACNMEKDPFYNSTKALLKNIPGLKIVELKKRCGHNNFDRVDAKTKTDAVELMKEASKKDADIIVCTSPYCQSHLLLCSREGSWRSVDIEISDLYQILLKSITGEI